MTLPCIPHLVPRFLHLAPKEKPTFVFDGRNLLDFEALRVIGFEVSSIGKS